LAKGRKPKSTKVAKAYEHLEKGLLRPEVGLQSQFKQRKSPTRFRYDPSLSPELSWDESAHREHVEALIRRIRDAPDLEGAKTAANELGRMSRYFLNWAGKAEREEFEVPTLPLFVHERLSTKAILESLRGHRPQQTLDLFGDSGLDITDRILKAYEHKAPWTNRLILGDSLVVMNSLVQFEGLGGQVQMIYVDPPYGVKFGSNFQPFIRKREVKHGDDRDLTREPEMIQAYRDTWELGIHSYLTYLRDRLLVSRELLHPSGSIFVQISDENQAHVREVMDEVFGEENFVSQIAFLKTTSATTKLLASVSDYLLWYCRDISLVKYKQLYLHKSLDGEGASAYNKVQLPDGRYLPLTKEEAADPTTLPKGARVFTADNLTSQNPGSRYNVEFEGKKYRPEPGWWKTDEPGMRRLIEAGRVYSTGDRIRFKRFIDDFPVFALNNTWTDTGGEPSKIYVVQTASKVIARCLLMTTDPGDLVLDPTCGSGTTAYVAESWGRRWITIDTSRVPLALARQRLLTATYPYFLLKQESTGPSGGFIYQRRQDKKGQEVGGIVPRVTLGSITRNERAEEVVLVDAPEASSEIVRVTGTFAVEAAMPVSTEAVTEQGLKRLSEAQSSADHIDRVLDALTRAGSIRLPAGGLVHLQHARIPAQALDIHAEAEENSGENPRRIAIVIGPPDGPVTETLVYRSAKEANVKGYSHLYVIGFAVEDAASKLINNAGVVLGIPASYVNAALDILMGDGGWNLLKTTRASEIFTITGSPDVLITRIKGKADEGEDLYQAHLRGVDIFDPAKMGVHHIAGDDVPAWLLDTDYNELAFWVSQAFFPKTGAWENLKKELRGVYRDEVWDHLAGTTSAPFPAGKHERIAVKVIDERGNELLVVKKLSEAETV
jgi:adenine-specific DNA-methyltransferase